LHHAIQAFRQQFAPRYFTDERVIDLLIWAYVKLLKSGALTTRQIIYR
jgi:hypothetical protein